MNRIQLSRKNFIEKNLNPWLSIIRKTGLRGLIYSPLRIGKGGKLFRQYKLRTMHLNALELEKQILGNGFKNHNDPRILPGAKLLRDLHVDEWPQLINVFKG